MIDFTVKGTKLPVIHPNIEYRCNTWKCTEPNANFNITRRNYISYGAVYHKDVIYILAESETFAGKIYFMFKESDIIKLAKEQGIIEDEFILPEKWVVEVTSVNDYKEDALNKKYDLSGGWIAECEGSRYYYYSDDKNGYANPKYVSVELHSDYKLITFEQFQKYVLKKDIMEKEIVGYKLIKPEYRSCCEVITKLSWPTDNVLKYDGYTNSIKSLKDAGVLNLWFEPIYKELTPNITINGYKGEFFETYIKFGCAEIDKKFFTDIYCRLILNKTKYYSVINKELESITIGKGTFTREQIQQIAEYYIEKSKGL